MLKSDSLYHFSFASIENAAAKLHQIKSTVIWTENLPILQNYFQNDK